ncbi:hypothetical protein PO909_023109 [Leuciscus waleckii]
MADSSACVENQRILVDLPKGVVNTITQSRAPSTRRLYASKWSVFHKWCTGKNLNPQACGISWVLCFLQELLDAGRSPSMLKVYVAAIAAFADSARGRALGRNEFIIRFLKGARRMNPPRPPSVPIWDLSLVLEALKAYPFEPLDTVDLKYLTFKTVFLIALSSVKRVGDLHALSVNAACLEFGPNDSIVILKPRHGYVPKVVPSNVARPVVLQAFHPPPHEAAVEERLHRLCPIRALRIYIQRSSSWRKSDQLLVCFGSPKKGLPASKPTISNWIIQAISSAYQVRNLPSPLAVRAHSTRGMASSRALLSGVPIQEVCDAAGWATPHTFIRFYSLDLPSTPGTLVLSS